MLIDLHTHSDASDGTRPPAEVMWCARAQGVDVLALTDHDSVDGWPEAIAALPPGLTLVPGMELSCRTGGRSLHLLAYLFDPYEPELAAERDRIRDDRVHRARGMVERLAELGVPVTWDQVAAIAGGGAVGRPHIARAMVETGVIPTVEDAFTSKWIGTGGRAQVKRYALDPVQAVRLVTAAGGVAVLAHPRARKRGYVFGDDLVEELAGAGLAGVEVDHPDHDAADRAELRRLVKGLGLIITGSSDDHGDLTGDRLGCETTSRDALEELLDLGRGFRPVRGGEDDEA
ncbi:PHP domain-containing protein [Actinomadura scrupuli]|uniref:PHP domain-containing protein n=1 Tax=Actinomadura scrupuli TaxID=559629 RepID=UPI003D96650B